MVRELGGFDEEGEEDEATQKLPDTTSHKSQGMVLLVIFFGRFIKDCITIACTLGPQNHEKWRFFEA